MSEGRHKHWICPGRAGKPCGFKFSNPIPVPYVGHRHTMPAEEIAMKPDPDAKD